MKNRAARELGLPAIKKQILGIERILLIIARS